MAFIGTSLSLFLSLLVMAFIAWYGLSAYRRYTVTRERQYLYAAIIAVLLVLVLVRTSLF